MEPSLPRRQRIHTRKAPGVPPARLNGRNTDKPKAWSRPVPPHRYRFVINPASASNYSPPATQHPWVFPKDDVEGIHEGRALQQRQGKPGSAGWLGPFSRAGTHKQCRQSIQANNQAHLVWKAGCNKSVPSLTYPEA